jgi:hypothetical protein
MENEKDRLYKELCLKRLPCCGISITILFYLTYHIWLGLQNMEVNGCKKE